VDKVLQNSAGLEAPSQLLEDLSTPRDGVLTVFKLVERICASHLEAVPTGTEEDLERFGKRILLMRNFDCRSSAN
jgi:hypothetical protein